jgi:hypothetical protein
MLTLPTTWFSHDSAERREASKHFAGEFCYVIVPNWECQLSWHRIGAKKILSSLTDFLSSSFPSNVWDDNSVVMITMSVSFERCYFLEVCGFSYNGGGRCISYVRIPKREHDAP